MGCKKYGRKPIVRAFPPARYLFSLTTFHLERGVFSRLGSAADRELSSSSFPPCKTWCLWDFNLYSVRSARLSRERISYSYRFFFFVFFAHYLPAVPRDKGFSHLWEGTVVDLLRVEQASGSSLDPDLVHGSIRQIGQQQLRNIASKAQGCEREIRLFLKGLTAKKQNQRINLERIVLDHGVCSNLPK